MQDASESERPPEIPLGRQIDGPFRLLARHLRFPAILIQPGAAVVGHCLTIGLVQVKGEGLRLAHSRQRLIWIP